MTHHGIGVSLQPYLNMHTATGPHVVRALEGFLLTSERQFITYYTVTLRDRVALISVCIVSEHPWGSLAELAELTRELLQHPPEVEA